MESLTGQNTSPQGQQREQERPTERYLESSAVAEVRRLRGELITELCLQQGSFWNLVKELRERRHIVPSTKLPRPQFRFPLLLIPEGGPQFPGRPDQPPDNEVEAELWEQQEDQLHGHREEWLADINRIVREVVPSRYLGGYYSSVDEVSSWQAFVSACVLHDPPTTSLLQFARYADPNPYSIALPGAVKPSERKQHVFMAVPPIRILRDPHMAALIEARFWERILKEVEDRCLESHGIVIGGIVRNTLRECREIWQERRDNEDLNEPHAYILVDEGTTKRDVEKAFDAIAATQKRRLRPKPTRDPLLALQCAILYDDHNGPDPEDRRVKKYSHKRLAQIYNLSGPRAAKDHIELGRELRKNRITK